MHIKSCPITVKTAGTHEGTEEGVVEAIVAAYNVDSVGDRIIPGAFKKSLDRHALAGNRIPFVWSHKSEDPDSYIGEVIEAEERPEGLWVKAKLDIDEPKAAKVYKLLKGRRVSQFSFAYTETDARPAAKSDDGALKDLHELDIHECGPTMVGANPNTALLGVKAANHGLVCGECGTKRSAVDTETAAQTHETVTQDEVTDAEVRIPAAPVDWEDVVRRVVTEVMETYRGTDGSSSVVDDGSLSDTEATPDAKPADTEATENDSGAEEPPARAGTADDRLRTELDLLSVEFDDTI
jgi:HK97 family phage prohead protease